MGTTTLWNVAAWGWVCQGETRIGQTTVATWTRDEQVLVLVFVGEAEVQAAVLDGEHLTTEQIVERVTDGEHCVNQTEIFDRAAYHLEQTRDDRVATELAHLFAATHKLVQPHPAKSDMHHVPLIPLRMRTALWNLALAVLSTPAS